MSESAPFDDLRVPGDPGVWVCARHKDTQTRLRCGRCEKPICPKCTIMGPTGARCRDCASNRSSHIYQVSPAQFGLAFVAAMGMGAIGAAVTQAIGGLWFWAVLYAPAVGPLAGRLITRITGGKRGAALATVVSLGLVVGGVGAALAYAMWSYSRGQSEVLAEMEPLDDQLPPQHAAKVKTARVALSAGLLVMMAIANLPLWLFLGLAIVGVWWWLK